MHLHNPSTILDTAEVKIDICTECKKKLIYRKDANGRIDNERYYEDHRRNYLQRDDPLFYKYNDKPFDLEEDKKFIDKEYKKYMEQVEINNYYKKNA